LLIDSRNKPRAISPQRESDLITGDCGASRCACEAAEGIAVVDLAVVDLAVVDLAVVDLAVVDLAAVRHRHREAMPDLLIALLLRMSDYPSRKALG
jgi:hypothetical protein